MADTRAVGETGRVYSKAAGVWVPAMIISREGKPGSDEERIVVEYDVAGVGRCEKKLRADSQFFRLDRATAKAGISVADDGVRVEAVEPAHGRRISAATGAEPRAASRCGSAAGGVELGSRRASSGSTADSEKPTSRVSAAARCDQDRTSRHTFAAAEAGSTSRRGSTHPSHNHDGPSRQSVAVAEADTANRRASTAASDICDSPSRRSVVTAELDSASRRVSAAASVHHDSQSRRSEVMVEPENVSRRVSAAASEASDGPRQRSVAAAAQDSVSRRVSAAASVAHDGTSRASVATAANEQGLIDRGFVARADPSNPSRRSSAANGANHRGSETLTYATVSTRASTLDRERAFPDASSAGSFDEASTNCSARDIEANFADTLARQSLVPASRRSSSRTVPPAGHPARSSVAASTSDFDTSCYEVDQAAMKATLDPCDQVAQKFSIFEETLSDYDEIQDALTELTPAGCDIFLNHSLDWRRPPSSKAMAWTFFQCNQVMSSTKKLPFLDVFPTIADRMVSAGLLQPIVTLLLAEPGAELEDYIADSWKSSDMVAVGVMAAQGHRLWNKLKTAERRMFTKFLDEGGIPSATDVLDLLRSGRSLFTAFRLHYDRPDGEDAAMTTLKHIEPEDFLQIHRLDKEASRSAANTLVDFYLRNRETERFDLIVERLTPMLDRAFADRFVVDNGLEVGFICKFLISFVSALRARGDRDVKDTWGNLTFQLLGRAFDGEFKDTEADKATLIETAFLLLDTSKEAPLRRWANVGVRGGADSAMLEQRIGEWCTEHLCNFARPWLEQGLGDDTISPAAVAVARVGPGGELWRHDPTKDYFHSEQGLARRDVDVVQMLKAYFRLCSWTTSGWPLIAIVSSGLDSAEASETFGPLETLVPRWSTLRQAVVIDVRRIYDNIVPAATCDSILGCRSLYRDDFREIVMGFVTQREDSAFHGCYWEVVDAVAKLDSLTPQDNPKLGFDEVKDLLQDLQTRKFFAKTIRRAASMFDASVFIEAEGEAEAGELSVFTFEKLRACGMRLKDICDGLTGELSPKMMNNLDNILEGVLKARPVAWLPMIINIDTILLALKYQDQEDLPTAFQKFRAANKDSDFKPGDFTSLLEVVQQVFRQPIIDTKSVDLLSDALDVRDKILQTEASSPLTDTVMWRKSFGSGTATFSPEDWRLILDIAIAQMENMRQKLKIFLQPHHTQMVTLLLFAFLVNAANKGDKDGYKTVMAEVGTGEGKSWIIAMIAAYIAKKGFRAHVLVDNAALRHRDLAMMRDFFTGLGIQITESADRPGALTDKSARIVYCAGRDLDEDLHESIVKGSVPDLSDAILIVDECDGLIIDQSANTHWRGKEADLVQLTNTWLNVWRETQSLSSVSEQDMDEFTIRLFRRVKQACRERSKKRQGIDYEVISGKFYYLDPITRAPTRMNPLWLEVLRAEADVHFELRSSNTMTICSHVEGHRSYCRLFGLTASLGGPAERNFVKSVYQAVSFVVPSFLDTCPRAGGGKRRAVLKEIDHMVQDTEFEQVQRVVQIAAAKCLDVPVLILAENPHIRQHFIEALKACPELPEEYKVEDSKALLQIGGEGPDRGDDVVRKVELATKAVLSARRKGRKTWPISVGCPESGRGHDYRVIDATVDKHGGLLVILTFVPLSIRDWRQFKGRTARQDRHGQYAVILNAAEHPDLAIHRDRGVRGDDMIKALFGAMDAKKAKDLSNKYDEIEKGAIMMELSRQFWQLKGDGVLSTTQVHQWCLLCEDFYNMSNDAIRSFWDKHVLPATR